MLKMVEDANNELLRCERALGITHGEIQNLERASKLLDNIVKEKNEQCFSVPNKVSAEKVIISISQKSEVLKNRIQILQNELIEVGKDIVNNARVVFCTLTKNYMGKDLQDQKFDAVIIDEISMALPPLIFLAAGRASSRVIQVGDFLQLPPIVRSDTEISNERLKSDIFHLAGVAKEMKPVNPCPVLHRLSTQHRMLTPIAEVARNLVYDRTGFKLLDDESVRQRAVNKWLDFLPENPLIVIDTADLHSWCGKQPGTLSRFNIYSATSSVELAGIAAGQIRAPGDNDAPPIGIITPYAAQKRLLTRLISEMELNKWVAGGTVHTFQGNQAELVIFDSVLDEPYWTSRLTNPNQKVDDVLRDLNVAVTRAKNKFIFIGSSDWLNKHAKVGSGLGNLWSILKDRADLLGIFDLLGQDFKKRIVTANDESNYWCIPKNGSEYKLEILDENSFFYRFEKDMRDAKTAIFGLAPYFGQYRWPKIQPYIAAALARNVAVTLVVPPLTEAENPTYVNSVIKNLRELGAVVITATGIHGKDVIIDEELIYTGSMNWSSNRGRVETIHRIYAPKYAKQCLEYMQAKYIRQSAHFEDGSIRVCPSCGYPIKIVNQRRQHGSWDSQALKVACTNSKCKGYLRNIDERPPFRSIPLCHSDRRTKYRRVRRGKGELWQCPKHPKHCPNHKAIPGDPQ